MRCFKCANEIVELPEGDPARQSEDWHYTPAFVVEVLKDRASLGEEGCHCTVVCWTCMHEIQPDMWMAGDDWDAMSPAVPYEKLPPFDHDVDDDSNWNAETYSHVVVPAPLKE